MKHNKFLPTALAAALALALALAGCSQPEAPAPPSEPGNGEPEVTMNAETPATTNTANPADARVNAQAPGSEESATKVATLDVPGMT